MKRKRSWLSRRLPYIYGAFIIVGFLLVDWAGYDLLLPDPAPYRYELVSEGTIRDYPNLPLSAPETLLIRKYEARIDENGSPFADFYVGDLGAGVSPILLDWQNSSMNLEMAMAGRPKELDELAHAIREHVPKEAVILGWWDTSRQLAALASAQIRYQDNLPRTLFIPPNWQDDISAIQSLESIFWRISQEAMADFDLFIDALSSQVKEGIGALQKIAGSEPAFVVLQLSDMYKVSLSRPALVNVGFHNFTTGTEIHGDIVRVKRWLEEQQLTNYAVEASGITSKRVYYVRDEVSTNTLIAQMLPLTGFNPTSLHGLKLVANYGSYWVYEILPADA